MKKKVILIVITGLIGIAAKIAEKLMTDLVKGNK